MAADGWIWPSAAWLGSDLGGKTLGLVGVGRIGANLARMAQGFGMRVLGFDPFVLKKDFVEPCSDLRQMLCACDFVSIHCVLNPATRHLIGEAELRAMKASAFLINVSRGAIVDERCMEVLEGRPVLVKSHDPRLRAQRSGARFAD